jgi:hypothetical protein
MLLSALTDAKMNMSGAARSVCSIDMLSQSENQKSSSCNEFLAVEAITKSTRQKEIDRSLIPLDPSLKWN